MDQDKEINTWLNNNLVSWLNAQKFERAGEYFKWFGSTVHSESIQTFTFSTFFYVTALF